MALQCFNSLQTGKCIQSHKERGSLEYDYCFNSLQTGKCIQRLQLTVLSKPTLVSIPFKRESVSKAIPSFPRKSRWGKFQFPSNGKVYPKLRKLLISGLLRITSFQFPSNGKVYPKPSKKKTASLCKGKFQFPSNGKVYPKRIPPHQAVPIPLVFQFPSNGKVYPKTHVTGSVTP